MRKKEILRRPPQHLSSSPMSSRERKAGKELLYNACPHLFGPSSSPEEVRNALFDFVFVFWCCRSPNVSQRQRPPLPRPVGERRRLQQPVGEGTGDGNDDRGAERVLADGGSRVSRGRSGVGAGRGGITAGRGGAGVGLGLVLTLGSAELAADGFRRGLTGRSAFSGLGVGLNGALRVVRWVDDSDHALRRVSVSLSVCLEGRVRGGRAALTPWQ